MQTRIYRSDSIFSERTYLPGSLHLREIGDVYCGFGHRETTVEQTGYVIAAVMEGAGVFTVEGKMYEVSENDVVFCCPGQELKMDTCSGIEMHYIYVQFYFTRAESSMPSYGEIKSFFDHAVLHKGTASARIQSMMSSAVSEMLFSRPKAADMMQLYLSQIVIETYRSFAENTGSPPGRFHTEEQIVYAVLKYIDSTPCTVSSLSSISFALGYSYSYLSQLFSKKLGCSIQSYFRKKMFSQAIGWMKEGIRITEISQRLGYSTVYSFSRAFARWFGVPPSQYREQMYKKGLINDSSPYASSVGKDILLFPNNKKVGNGNAAISHQVTL